MFHKIIISSLYIFQIFLLNVSFYTIKLFSAKSIKYGWVVGVYEIAGNIAAFGKVLENTTTISLNNHRFYDYKYTYSINIKNKFLRRWYINIYAPLLLGYLMNKNTHFWYIWRTGFLINREYEFRFLKKHNKKLVCMFVGDDIRTHGLSLEYTRSKNLDHFCEYRQINSVVNYDNSRRETARVADENADVIFSFEFCQISYIKSKQYPWPVMYDINKFNKNEEKFKNYKKIKVLHAPSCMNVKGTPLVRAAIKKLQIEGYDFEYVELTNSKNKDVLKNLNTAHIVLNQFYLVDMNIALLAVEAMANNCAVMMSYEPSMQKHYDLSLEGFEEAMINTKYWEIYDKLKDLLDNTTKIKYYANNGYEYAKRYCTYQSAKKYYNRILKDKGVLDIDLIK